MKIIFCASALIWWLFCEYLRGKTSTPRHVAKLLGIIGALGGWGLLLIAFLVKE